MNGLGRNSGLGECVSKCTRVCCRNGDCLGVTPERLDESPNQDTGLSFRGGEIVLMAPTELGGYVTMATNDLADMDLESDPSSLASQAAVELDNLLRARRDDVPAVRRLGELIQEEFSGLPHRATTVGVMKRAISASGVVPTSLAKVEDVQKGAKQVSEVLIRIGCRPYGCKAVIFMLLRGVEWGSCSGSERSGHAQALGFVVLGSI